MTFDQEGDTLYTWLIGGIGIHNRLKICRPYGLAGSSPASATITGGKVKTIIKLMMAPVAAYFGLNWAADNPLLLKGLRNKVDQRVESGYEFVLFEFKSYSSEPAQKPVKKQKKEQPKEIK